MDLAPAAFLDAHVLIADPDADSRELHALSVEPLTTDVELVADGADALAAALARPPALVIAELQLPRIDGVTLCAMLRSEPRTRGASILVVTSAAAAVHVQRALEAGAAAVLVKPAGPDRVRDEARRLLTSARQVQGTSGRRAPEVAGQRARELFDRTAAINPRVMSRSYGREVTTTPPEPPPALSCPACLEPLLYLRSHLGGVSARHPEQWDYYRCGRCGTYQYRHRTRKLRKI